MLKGRFNFIVTLHNRTSFFPVLHVLLITILSMLFIYPSYGQSSASLQKRADTFFDAGDYRSALQLYRQAGLESSKNKKTRLRIGISLYEINDVDGAASVFHSLIKEGKTEADVFLYIAKSYQAKNLFPEAITNYKKYLQRTKSDDPRRSWVKDELVRCANGLRLKYGDQDAYVENAGSGINTQHADFGLKYSPTMIDRVYFNSDRESSVDIYSAELVNGRWSSPQVLPAGINSPGYDEVAGFNADGQVLYYLTAQGEKFKILTDTFSGAEGVFYQGVFDTPWNDADVNADLTFFNDTICLFSSNRAGGYGGYDLYISVNTMGQWTAPMNLGPTINSFYDDRFPFLTRDGLTLYFSSNNLQSMGGFDVFQSAFDNAKLKWSALQNLGMPVNSSLDDTHFVLSPDGMSAFISSNRKDSHGEYDLYRILFKQPVHAHQQISPLTTFYQSITTSGGETLQVPEEVAEKPIEVKEYFLSHLFIDQQGDVLTPQNIKKLDLLANLLLIYPRIKAELSSFEIPSGQKTFSLYFSIKKAEQAAEYLIRKGVAKDRLIIKGYGSSFPLALNQTGAPPSAVYLKLNHRLEIGLHDLENEPVLTHIENIPVPENLRDSRGVKFSSIRHGFYYSVQITSISQILQNMSLETVDEMFIEVNNVQGTYRYMVGMLPTFAEAQQKLNEMVRLGFPDAYIVPYLDGIRIHNSELNTLKEKFPDLNNFIGNIKE